METILLLLEQRRNRELLGEMLGREFRILEETPTGLEGGFDLAILDARTLDRLQGWLAERRAREAPCFLPVLLVASRPDIGYATRQLWKNCDEIILSPIEKVELRARTEILLRARRFSLEVKNHYFTLAGQVPIGVFVVREGKIAWANPALGHLVGRQSERLAGVSWVEMLAFEDRASAAARAQQAAQGAASVGLVRLPDAAGKRWGELRLSPLGPPVGNKFLGLLADVTPERELSRIKDEFLSMASHELNTPLAAILGFAELLRADPDLDLDHRAEYLEHIHQNAESLSRIVQDLLNLAQVRLDGTLPLQRSTFDLRELAEILRKSFLRDHPHRPFLLKMPEEPVMVRADRELIFQALANLLSNAVKFSSSDSPVSLEVEADREVRIAVIDRGIGMSREQRRRVWEPFQKADASDTAVGGFGLGLTVVRAIAEAHGGRAELESVPGRGSRAVLVLPGRGTVCGQGEA